MSTIIELARQFRKEFEATREVSRKYVLSTELSYEEMQEIIEVYPTWEEFKGKLIPKDKIIRYNNELYKVVKGIDWQADWTPDVVASDFTKITAPTTGGGEEIVAPWEQRYGHNPYVKGDKVLWQNKVYECVLDTTTYSPTDYAQAWRLVE